MTSSGGARARGARREIAVYSAPVRSARKSVRAVVLLTVLFMTMGAGPGGGDLHAVVPRVLLALAIVLVLAKLAGFVFERMSLPPVLGELLAGVLLGNLHHLGFRGLDFIGQEHVVRVLAELGVVILLFEVGLESNLTQMRKVGASAFLVATVGVVTPMALGFLVARALLPSETWHGHVFIGAILCATSVGITARVLKDLGAVGSIEGRIILGAAVIDDVMGLVVLAVVKGVVAGSSGGGLSAVDVLVIVAKAVGFLGVAMAVGGSAARTLFTIANRVYVPGLLLAVALAFCFAASYAAYAVGLAPIVGAFAAGLVLERVHWGGLAEKEGHGLEELVHPIASFLVPVFFVITGFGVDLAVLGDAKILGFAALLTGAALAGKQVCALATLEPGLNRLAVGIGMIPRGEVGLIFASVGAATLLPDGTPVVGPSTYAAVVIMVMISTLITPPLLAWQIRRRGVRS
jgi:Kef-type K+ transport system membrane component KefB